MSIEKRIEKEHILIENLAKNLFRIYLLVSFGEYRLKAKILENMCQFALGNKPHERASIETKAHEVC
jgi:hypothetical protein